MKKTRATRTVEGYMCMIDFDCELDSAAGGTKVYASIDDLKEDHDCWKSCGIVEVEVKYVKTIEEQNFEYEYEQCETSSSSVTPTSGTSTS